ncbi:hypothetical protein Dsin_008717 [Dipteronia sinensis]|uniref:Reverse transcriptase domain-containing protein n=1 Tax=Dipteronia sinensis TaxID=43782 RepID=A0AAE0EBE9_9ROSI|nr:hypothetical protein Dsin_008717 [Dipteronia sinensis]
MRKWLSCNKKRENEGRIIENRLAAVEALAEKEGWTDRLRKQRVNLLSELWKAIRKEEQLWRQKSRVGWLNEGDKNSKFFHSLANGRRRRNHISELSFGDGKVSDPVLLKEMVVDFSKDHYTNVKWRCPMIRGLNFRSLSDTDSEALEMDFNEEEVWNAMCNCDGNKAPGPDGLNLNFVKANWGVIKEDFMKFIHEFYKKWEIMKDLNKTFIALILKCAHPETIREYRPISLVSSMFKILAKVLANCLKLIMDSMMGETQMAFVKNRKITDSFVIAEEIIHSWRKDKVGGLLVKLDFEKAYDSVDHGFLDFVMAEIGFRECWRLWMKWCISTPSMSVLVNESPSMVFGVERGLRQGDPLSPFLFNLAVECLSCCFLDLNMDKGIGYGNGEVHVSHLQYADDTILFLEPKTEFLVNSKRILRCYEMISGLRINFHKSFVVMIGKKRMGDED